MERVSKLKRQLCRSDVSGPEWGSKEVPPRREAHVTPFRLAPPQTRLIQIRITVLSCTTLKMPPFDDWNTLEDDQDEELEDASVRGNLGVSGKGSVWLMSEGCVGVLPGQGCIVVLHRHV